MVSDFFFLYDSEKYTKTNKINKMFIITKKHLNLSKYFIPTKKIRKNYNWLINPFLESNQNILSITN